MLNATRFDDKRKVKCRLMRGEEHKYTLKWYMQNLFEL